MGAGLAGSTGGDETAHLKTPSQTAIDTKEAAVHAAIIRIADAQKEDARVAKVRSWIEGGSHLTTKDLKEWAEASPTRIRAATPLVMELDWKPSKALAFLDKNLEPSTRLEDLITLLIAGQDRTETVAGARITIARNDKGKVVMTIESKG
jgi:hypothetical protein